MVFNTLNFSTKSRKAGDGVNVSAFDEFGVVDDAFARGGQGGYKQ